MQGVIFDLDGVITDTAKFHFQAWSAIAKTELEILLPKKFESELKGIGRIDSIRRIIDFSGSVDCFSEEDIFQMADRKNKLYLEKIKALTAQDVLPGIYELIKELKQHQIKIGLASASINATFILKRLNLESYFDTIVDPTQVAAGKPSPDLFIQAAKQLELPCRGCVGIEDAKAGIQAIKAAKMKAIGVGDVEELYQADVIVRETSELNYYLLNQK